MQNTKTQLHFIIGIGRSGTTILTKLLNTYKDIHCMPEANFLVFFLKKFSDKNIFTKKDIEQIFEEIKLYSYSHPWVGWNFDPEEAKSNVLKALQLNSELKFPELIKLIYKQFNVDGTDKTSANIIIDKNPSFTIFVNQIHKTFPESKFIWIVRDYRANILSRKQSVFLKSPNIAYNAVRWKIYNQIAYNFYKKNKDKVILVRYEDIVKDDAIIEKIASFLSVDTRKKENENIQSINLEAFNIEEKYQERFKKKYSDLNKKLNSDRINSWQEQLSESEIRICDALCYKVAETVGYNPLFKSSIFSIIKTYITQILPVSSGYFDIFKDKILFYFPLQFKLNRLKKRYIEIGFIKK
ncbi:MAG: sulfotransferase [Bacteroidetes bacterium]|nr:sulfotransferase [Bacteroidota bacterium]